MLNKVIWATPEIDYFRRKDYIESIVDHLVLITEKRQKIRQWIIEVLQEKAKTSIENKVSINGWLEHTNNLTKFD